MNSVLYSYSYIREMSDGRLLEDDELFSSLEECLERTTSAYRSDLSYGVQQWLICRHLQFKGNEPRWTIDFEYAKYEPNKVLADYSFQENEELDKRFLLVSQR